MTAEISLSDPYTVPTRYWHRLDDGRLQCDVCPRACRLHEGQRGLCFVRGRIDEQVVMTSYGRSSGFCVDPIEKSRSIIFCPEAPYCPLVLQAAIWLVGSVRTGTYLSRVRSID